MTLSKIFVVCVHTHNYHYDLENERKGELIRIRSESLFRPKYRALLRVGSKSHCRAVPAVPCPIWCASNLIFIDDVSFKL